MWDRRTVMKTRPGETRRRRDLHMADGERREQIGTGGQLNKEARIQTVCLVILTVLAGGAALYWLESMLVPFVLALFIAIGLNPLVDLLMRRLRLPRTLAVLVTLLVGFCILAAVGVLVSTSVGGLTENADMYQEHWNKLVERIVTMLSLDRFGIDAKNFLSTISGDSSKGLHDLLLSIGSALTNVVSSGAVVLIFLCFFLFGAGGHKHQGQSQWGQIEANVRRYITVKTMLSLTTGVLVGGVLWVLEVPLAIVFGLLAFVLNYVPNVGSIIATALPLPVVLLNPDVSITTAVLAIALPGGVQMVIGNIVEPKLMGKSFDLHAVTVLLALIFWGMLWGVIGMLLAVPITAAIKIILSRHDRTRVLADVLAGRLPEEKGQASGVEQ